MQKNRKRKLSAPVALLIALVVCATAFFSAWLWKGNTAAGAGAKQVNANSVESVVPLKEGFVYYNGTTLGYVTSSGKVQWTYMAGTDVQFSASEYGIAVWKNKTLTLIDLDDGTIYYSVAQAEDVISATVGPKYVAVAYGEAQNSKVMLLDSSGGFVKTLDFASRLILDCGFYSSGSYFWVLALETDGTVASTTVSTYKPSSQLISGSITDGSQITYDCYFLDGEIRCVGDTNLKVYDYSGNEMPDRRELIYGWYLAAAEDSSVDPVMVLIPDDAYKGMSKIQDAMILTSAGKEFIRFQFGCDEVFVANGVIYGFSSDYGCVMVTTPGSGKIVATPVSVQFDSVYGIVGGRAIVGQGGAIYLVDLE